MCTVSIVNRGDSILVTMNRDERRERSEEGMFSYRKQGVDLLFPRDGLAGGSWIACSERGELACLLNRYDDVEQRERPRVRHARDRDLARREDRAIARADPVSPR